MPRTRDTHAHHIRSLEGPLNSHSSMTYGLTRDSCLNSSSYFHVTEGLAPDIMHDVLEGVAQYEVNWWRTPAESPDLNPVENLWHKLKKYVRRARTNLRYSPVLGYCGYSKMSEVYSPLEKGSTSSYSKLRRSYWLLTFVFFTLYTLIE